MEQKEPVRDVPAPTQQHMAPQVLSAICETIGTRKAESGGMLGGNRQTGEVTHFSFDADARQSSVIYTPNTAFLNTVKREWREQGIDFLGSVHSHPRYICHPSAGDEVYVRRILDVLDVSYMLVHIVTTLADTGSFTLYPFAASRQGNGLRIIKQELVVGGSLIRPAAPQVQDKSEDAEEYLALLMEMSMTAMWYGSMPWVETPPMRQRRDGYDRRRTYNDYD
jgi:proteasome lid subunit RPN8/RPN11